MAGGAAAEILDFRHLSKWDEGKKSAGMQKFYLSTTAALFQPVGGGGGTSLRYTKGIHIQGRQEATQSFRILANMNCFFFYFSICFVRVGMEKSPAFLCMIDVI